MAAIEAGDDTEGVATIEVGNDTEGMATIEAETTLRVWNRSRRRH